MSHFLLTMALNKNGMTLKDVNVVNLSAGDAAAAFMAGRVDAAVVWNPWVNTIQTSGKGKPLFTSKDVPGMVPDLLVVQDKSLKAKRKDFVGMIKAWYDVEAFLRSNPDEAAKIMSKVVGMDAKEYKVFLPGTKFFDQKANLQAFGPATDPTSLLGVAPTISKFLLDNKLMEGKVDFAKGLDAFAGQGSSWRQVSNREHDDAIPTRHPAAPSRHVGDPRAAVPGQYWLFAALGLLAPLALWWLVSSGASVNKVFMPGPVDVFNRLIKWYAEDDLLSDMGISIYRVTAGLALSAVIALPIGLMIGTFRPVQALLEPLTDFHPLHAGGGVHSAGDAVGGHRRVVQDRHHLHRHLLPDGADGGRGCAPRARRADRGGADHGREPRRTRSSW